MKSNNSTSPFSPVKHVCIKGPSSTMRLATKLLPTMGATKIYFPTGNQTSAELSPAIQSDDQVAAYLDKVKNALYDHLLAAHQQSSPNSDFQIIKDKATKDLSEVSMSQLEPDEPLRQATTSDPRSYLKRSLTNWIESSDTELAQSCYLTNIDGQCISLEAAQENIARIVQLAEKGDKSALTPMAGAGVCVNRSPETIKCVITGKPIKALARQVNVDPDKFIGAAFTFSQIGNRTCLIGADGTVIGSLTVNNDGDAHALTERITACLNHCRDMTQADLSTDEQPQHSRQR